MFYKSVSMDCGAAVVQELNWDKVIIDLTIEYFGTCTSLPDHMKEIQQFPSCTLTSVCEYMPTLVVWSPIQYLLQAAKYLFNLYV